MHFILLHISVVVLIQVIQLLRCHEEFFLKENPDDFQTPVERPRLTLCSVSASELMVWWTFYMFSETTLKRYQCL